MTERAVSFTADAWQDYVYWSVYWNQRDRPMLKRLNALIRAIHQNPFAGIGKPEPLRHALSGCWSRRIDQEHRLVYRYERGQLIALQCRYHY